MARMHSRKKGKSKSKKPLKAKKPIWERYNKKEVLLLIEKLAKSNPPSKIGLILRDTYGIPDIKILTGSSLTAILKDLNLTPKLPEDLSSLIKREIKILKHLETNKKDQPTIHGLRLTESKIKRLSKYYKKINKLPKAWKFNREKAKLLLE